MIATSSDWYKTVWSLDIKQQSWTENTVEQVEFIIKQLGLQGKERILDLGCGYGRHSLEFAKRGYEVVGVDITLAYVEDARKEAKKLGVDATFICEDIRNVSFVEEFDVVMNLADGAIGYLENDSENLRIFDVIAKALKQGGQSFIDIQSGDYADAHFPVQLWDAGSQSLSISKFDWDKETRIMLYGQLDYKYGEVLTKPEMNYGFPTRLYTQHEIEQIMQQRGMELYAAYCNVNGELASKNGFQMMACSRKK